MPRRVNRSLPPGRKAAGFFRACGRERCEAFVGADIIRPPQILKDPLFFKRRTAMKTAIGILTVIAGAALAAAGVLTLIRRPRARVRRGIRF